MQKTSHHWNLMVFLEEAWVKQSAARFLNGNSEKGNELPYCQLHGAQTWVRRCGEHGELFKELPPAGMCAQPTWWPPFKALPLQGSLSTRSPHPVPQPRLCKGLWGDPLSFHISKRCFSWLDCRMRAAIHRCVL